MYNYAQALSNVNHHAYTPAQAAPYAAYGNLEANPYFTTDGCYGCRAGNTVLEIIREAIQDEMEDAMFYDMLIREAPTTLEKQVITHIRNDEHRHRQMLMQMYAQMSGQSYTPGPGASTPPPTPTSYVAGLEKAILGELAAFEKYRNLYIRITPQYRDAMFIIMTDEIKHAGYFNWMYAKNK